MEKRKRTGKFGESGRKKRRRKEGTFINDTQRVEASNFVSSHQGSSLAIVVIGRARYDTSFL